MLELLYYLMEHLDGERGGAVFVPYKAAQAVKMWCLKGIR